MNEVVPLTEEELASRINVDVFVSETWTLSPTDGYEPDRWREMLREVQDGTADDEAYLHDFPLDYDVTLSLRNAPKWVVTGSPSPEEEEDVDPDLAAFLPKRVTVSERQAVLL